MSTDRELLEDAARAAGYRLHWGITDSMIECNEPDHPGKTHNLWNPLEDDGDAFRLAVALKMDVFVRHRSAEAVGPMGEPHKVWYDTDPAAATRRAIVRAAAAMART